MDGNFWGRITPNITVVKWANYETLDAKGLLHCQYYCFNTVYILMYVYWIYTCIYTLRSIILSHWNSVILTLLGALNSFIVLMYFGIIYYIYFIV